MNNNYLQTVKCNAYLRKNNINDLSDWRKKMLELRKKYQPDFEKNEEFILLAQCKSYVNGAYDTPPARDSSPKTKPKPKAKPKTTRTRRRGPSPRSSSPNSIEYPFLRRCPNGRRRNKITHKCVKIPKK